MNWPLMSRRNGVPRARYEQVIDQRDDARKEAAEHVCKIVELCGDIDSLNEQLTKARKQLAESMAESQAHATRADRLQRRLDDSLGLNTPAVALGAAWQDRREQKMRYDA